MTLLDYGRIPQPRVLNQYCTKLQHKLTNATQDVSVDIVKESNAPTAQEDKRCHDASVMRNDI
eukprot:1846880-Amphidinium_carterae.1